MIESALVYDHIDKTYSKIYNKDRFNTVDSYDIFLSEQNPSLQYIILSFK